MDLKKQLDQDLKKAMLGGDKVQATTLRGLKSAILYVEVAEGKREQGLTDEEISAVLAKEAKKRLESITLYEQAGDTERASNEQTELEIIQSYLPKQLSDAELEKLVEDAISESGADSQAQMGQVIGVVKQKAGPSADGARIAQMVKARLGS